MADIYVRQLKGSRPRRRRRGPLLLLLAVVLGAAALWFGKSRKDKTEEAPPAPVAEEAQAPANKTAKVIEPEETAQPEPAKTASSPKVPAISSPQTAATLQQVKALIEQDDLPEARTLLYRLLDSGLSTADTVLVKKLIGNVNTILAFSPRPMPEKNEYVIQSGDSFWKLKNIFNTTIPYLEKANNLKSNQIRPGDRIRYINGTFSILVDLSDYELTVFLDGRFFKSYPVGIGKYGKTPSGEYTIGPKLWHPEWDRRSKGEGIIPYGDPKNELGVCWLTLEPAQNGLPRDLGIHGTNRPETIGTNASAGCVRMRNEDVEELFALIVPDVKVTIRN